MKVISVPNSKDALDRLDLGVEREGDLTEVILSDADFDAIFRSGWVERVNREISCNIDDYEDEHLLDEEGLEKLASITEKYVRNNHDVFSRILNLVGEARQKKTGLHFYF